MPVVSIVMPTHNAKKYLRESIDSIIAQTFTDWEFIIVNEMGSDDGTREIVGEYIRNDSRIRLIQNSSKLGISASLNAGMDAASGTYIARMDADDISMPDRLRRQVEYMDRHPEIGLVGCRVEEFGERTIEWNIETSPEVLKSDILFYSPCVHPTAMIRKTVLKENKIRYNEEYIASEDYDLFAKLSEYSEIGNIEDVLLRYRVYDLSATNRNNARGMQIYLEVMSGQMRRLALEFSEIQLKLLCVHYSFKKMKGEQPIKALIELDLLLKEIFRANEKQHIFDRYALFRTLHKRYGDAYASLSWACRDYDEYKAKVLFEKSIFVNREFYRGTTAPETSVTPLISVVLPTYNSEKYIADTLWSILNQTFHDFECLVINEYGSVDDTVLWVEAFGDPRVKIIQNEKKLGLAESINKGIRIAAGKYVARADADDLYITVRFERQYDYLEDNPDVSVCGTWQQHFGVETDFVHRPPADHESLKAHFIYNCEMCHSTIMIRQMDFIEKGLFYDSNALAEDYELWTRAVHQVRFANIPEVLCYYRVGEENITKKKIAMLGIESGEIAARNIQNWLHVGVSQSHVKYLDGWFNHFGQVKDRSTYHRLIETEKHILNDMWESNLRLGVYDNDSLLMVINKRLRWVTDTMQHGSEIEALPIDTLFQTYGAGKLSITNETAEDQYAPRKNIGIRLYIRRLLKQMLLPLWRPIKWRIVDPILRIEQTINDLRALQMAIEQLRTHQSATNDRIVQTEERILEVTSANINLAEEHMIAALGTQIVRAEEWILGAASARIWQVEENVNASTDASIAQAGKCITEAASARIWQAEEHILAAANACIWKAEERIAETASAKTDEIHRHIDFTYRDIMIVLDRLSHFAIKKNIRLDTDFPVAHESLDHLFPHGTVRDNTRYPRFIAKCEKIFSLKTRLSILDLGCSGGGMVLDALLRGHYALGLEGSNVSQIQQRAEWRLLPDNLITCDITKPFTVFDNDCGNVCKFDVITAWEVMEHIKEDDLPMLLDNIGRHLTDDGIFVASIANWADVDPISNINWHVTMKPYIWWMDLFLKNGFDIQTNIIDTADLARGAYNPPLFYESPSNRVDKETSFHIVAKLKM